MSDRYKNEVTLAGALSADPVIRATSTGKKVANLSLEIKARYSSYYNVTCWEGLADKVERLRKGSFIEVKGRLQTRSWSQGGLKRYSTEVVATEVIIEPQPEQAKPPITPNLHGIPIADSDIPF